MSAVYFLAYADVVQASPCSSPQGPVCRQLSNEVLVLLPEILCPAPQKYFYLFLSHLGNITSFRELNHDLTDVVFILIGY